MSHDEYWKKVMNRSEKTLCGLLEGCYTQVRNRRGEVLLRSLVDR